MLGVPCINSGGSGGGINPSVFGGSSLGINSFSDSNPSLQVPGASSSGANQRGDRGDDGPSSSSAGPSPRHHLQGTIV